jgi:hypothetical protein
MPPPPSAMPAVIIVPTAMGPRAVTIIVIIMDCVQQIRAASTAHAVQSTRRGHSRGRHSAERQCGAQGYKQ